ncbi:hypothetical protein [Pyrobaculum aerophilum]|uniref:hypothetical protein n=1 Tax=Pyrobaculum aerophilum TaxID=13773 RepID=UPI00257DDFAC|nr:hypothetical protein [Pyrobaculum sp.]
MVVSGVVIWALMTGIVITCCCGGVSVVGGRRVTSSFYTSSTPFTAAYTSARASKLHAAIFLAAILGA